MLRDDPAGVPGARLISAATYAATLALLLPTIGAAFAPVATSVAMRIYMAVPARRILRHHSDCGCPAEQTRPIPPHEHLEALIARAPEPVPSAALLYREAQPRFAHQRSKEQTSPYSGERDPGFH